MALHPRKCGTQVAADLAQAVANFGIAQLQSLSAKAALRWTIPNSQKRFGSDSWRSHTMIYGYARKVLDERGLSERVAAETLEQPIVSTPVNKKVSFGELPVSDLLDFYENAAAAHGRALESGDPRTANRNADVVAGVYRELRARGSEAQRQLLQFLSSADPRVRGWVGAHALEFAPSAGEPVLEELALIKKSFVAFSAQMTLQEWRKGTLKFP